MGMFVDEFEQNDGKQPPKRQSSTGTTRHDGHMGGREYDEYAEYDAYLYPGAFRGGACWPYTGKPSTDPKDTYNDLDSYYQD